MKKKKNIIMILMLLSLVMIVTGITSASILYTNVSTQNTIDLGRISMSYTEPSNAYVLDNALPIGDDEGRVQNKYFEFTVTSHATTKESDSTGITIPYEINISDIAIDEGMMLLDKSVIKINLTKVEGITENEVVIPTLISSLSNSSINENATVIYNAEDTHKNGSTAIITKYRLRAWITEEFDVSKNEDAYQYKFRINISSKVDALGTNKTEPKKLLKTAIMDQGVVDSGDGLYVSTQTNDNLPTYYYHGSVENNYIELDGVTKKGCFYNDVEILSSYGVTISDETCIKSDHICDKTAIGKGYELTTKTKCESEGGKEIEAKPIVKEKNIIWRVIRINEDGTIRIIAEATTASAFNYSLDEYKYTYYSESNINGGIKKNLNDWYDANLTEYNSKIATGTFCEQAKVKDSSSTTIGNAEPIYFENYKPDFKCEPDGNQYGLITDQKIGLITVDEALFAGAIFNNNSSTYLEKGSFWTMSPCGYRHESVFVWYMINGGLWEGFINNNETNYGVRPVVNLTADIMVSGNGTSTSPWVVTK